MHQNLLSAFVKLFAERRTCSISDNCSCTAFTKCGDAQQSIYILATSLLLAPTSPNLPNLRLNSEHLPLVTGEDTDETGKELITTSNMREGPKLALVRLLVGDVAFAESVGRALGVVLEAHFLQKNGVRSSREIKGSNYARVPCLVG